MLSAVLKMCLTDLMLRVDLKLSRHADEGHVLPNRDAAVVKEHVVVGTQAEDVIRRVGSVVGCSERSDVRGLGVGTGWGLQSHPAHLAPVVVELLDSSCLP